MTPEFDQYAPDYTRLLQDPIRDRFAGDSMFFHRRKWLLIRNFLRKRKIYVSGLSWLDVGCGQGELLKLAGSNFAHAAGCDPSKGMIQSGISGQICEQPSPAELPFPDQSFDFVTAVCVYHHVHGEQRALLTQSIRRVMRPGGLFCLIEHNPWNPVTRIIVRRCPVDWDAEFLTASRAASLLRSAKLDLLDTEYFLYFPEKMFSHIGVIETFLKKIPAGGQFALFCRKPSG